MQPRARPSKSQARKMHHAHTRQHVPCTKSASTQTPQQAQVTESARLACPNRPESWKVRQAHAVRTLQHARIMESARRARSTRPITPESQKLHYAHAPAFHRPGKWITQTPQHVPGRESAPCSCPEVTETALRARPSHRKCTTQHVPSIAPCECTSMPKSQKLHAHPESRKISTQTHEHIPSTHGAHAPARPTHRKCTPPTHQHARVTESAARTRTFWRGTLFLWVGSILVFGRTFLANFHMQRLRFSRNTYFLYTVFWVRGTDGFFSDMTCYNMFWGELPVSVWCQCSR